MFSYPSVQRFKCNHSSLLVFTKHGLCFPSLAFTLSLRRHLICNTGNRLARQKLVTFANLYYCLCLNQVWLFVLSVEQHRRHAALTVNHVFDLIKYPVCDEGSAGFLHASKDDIVSVALRSWVGNEFGFCSRLSWSYSMHLLCRAKVLTPFYKSLQPGTELDFEIWVAVVAQQKRLWTSDQLWGVTTPCPVNGLSHLTGGSFQLL